FRAAWKILRDGHELPAIDPALDEHIGTLEGGRANGSFKRVNGANGHANGSVSKANGSANGDAVVAPSAERSSPPRAIERGDDLESALRERTSLAGIGGRDVFEKVYAFKAADNARRLGMYPF